MIALPIDLTPAELADLIRLGLLEATRRTPDGRVTEYRLTHAGRTLVGGPNK